MIYTFRKYTKNILILLKTSNYLRNLKENKTKAKDIRTSLSFSKAHYIPKYSKSPNARKPENL